MPYVRRRYTFWIDDHLAEALKRIKQRDGVPESEQLRRAILAWAQAKGVNVPGGSKRETSKRKKGGV